MADQEVDSRSRRASSYRTHQQQQQQHSLQQEQQYDDDVDDEDEDEEEEGDVSQFANQAAGRPYDQSAESITNSDEGEEDLMDRDVSNENNDDEDDEDNESQSEVVFPPPVIAEINEDSQEYYMRPPEKMDDGPKPFRCDLCDKRFQEKSSVYRHIKEVHRKIIVLMGEDGRVARVKSSPVHSCCGTTFTTRRALIRHQKSAACTSQSGPMVLQSVHHQPQVLNRRTTRVNGTMDCNRNGASQSVGPPVITSSEEDLYEEDEESLDTDLHASGAPPAASSLSGIPYRCPYGVCPQFFTTKDLMTGHLKTVHRMRMELVSVSAPHASILHSNNSNSNLSIPSIPLMSSTSSICVTDKRFPCTHPGCGAAFTRKDRLNLHIRTKHTGSGGNSVPLNTGFMSGLKVKLPSMHQDNRMGILSANRSNTSSSSTGTRPAKETIHPKKHACDYPGCDKAYTKNSHVKRHKLSAHPDLYPSTTESNGLNASSAGSRVTSTTLYQTYNRVQGSGMTLNDEEEEDEGENGEGAGSDDDNFECFDDEFGEAADAPDEEGEEDDEDEDDDEDTGPPLKRSRGMIPGMESALKTSFLPQNHQQQQQLSSNLNGIRRRK